MSQSHPESFTASTLEEGQTCPCCQETIRAGEPIGRCPHCYHVQHEACWRQGGCRSYECDRATSRPQGERAQANLVITAEETAQARLLSQAPAGAPGGQAVAASRVEARTSTLAVIAFALALIGIPLLGLPGLIAIVVGAVAAGAINSRKDLKGIGFAIAAMVLGTLQVVGWTAAGCLMLLHGEFGGPQAPISHPLADKIDLLDLASTPEPIRKAIRANVLITVTGGLRTSQGSGVVLEKRRERVYVITNRHVVDASSEDITVTFAGGTEVPARLEWQGGKGMDVAVLSCSRGANSFEAAAVRVLPPLTVGEAVFAIGNPLGLGWSYSNGAISAIRRYAYESELLRLIQAQLPLNPGNSGGGLYDNSGALIGINTMTTAEGIGFALGISDLVPFLESQASLKLTRATPGGATPGYSEPVQP